jgi:hypothetical protein
MSFRVQVFWTEAVLASKLDISLQITKSKEEVEFLGPFDGIWNKVIAWCVVDHSRRAVISFQRVH